MASITKRGRYWRAQIIRRGYPPQYRTFDSRSEAEAWARVLESEMDRSVFVSRAEAERTTLAEALTRYEREISVGKAHPAQDKQRIRHWLRQPLAHHFLAYLRGADFAKYRDDRLAAGRAPNTVRLELALVSHLFEIARKEWGMEGLMNPFKNIRNGSSRTYVLCEGDTVIGYYCLAAGGLGHAEAPSGVKRNRPDPIPVLVLGRLAIHKDHHQKGIGTALANEAIRRAIQAAGIAGVTALLVHAISEQARRLYLSRGFIESPIKPMTLCLMLATVEPALHEP